MSLFLAHHKQHRKAFWLAGGLLLASAALLLLGVGWNFLYVGGTTLFTQAYRPEEKTSAQAAMDTVIFTTMTVTSFSSGALVTTRGWTLLNLGSIVPVLLAGVAIAWLALQRRTAQNQVPTRGVTR